jgi:hypothetical protein
MGSWVGHFDALRLPPNGERQCFDKPFGESDWTSRVEQGTIGAHRWWEVLSGRKPCGQGRFRVRCGAMRLLELPEGKTLEFKRDLSSPDGILKCMVGSANTAGGIIIIGVEDGTKHVRGVQDVLGAEEKLANMISDSIRPRLIPEIEVIPWRNLNVLAVQGYPSNLRLHYLERMGPEEGVYIRVGPKMEHSAHHHGASGPSGADHRRLASVGQGQVRSISGCLDSAGRFAGTNRTRLVDSADIRSFLPQSVEEANRLRTKIPDP